jgi:AcrR family transcriptional regulator
MGRHKTITDAALLDVAKTVFRDKGHTATTREIADAAGISEAVLYQRFASKDELFFAAMHATGPEIEPLLGPLDPPDDARAYLKATICRLGDYFAEVIPLALQVMMHPSFNPATLNRMQPGGAASLETELAKRLASLARRGRIKTSNPTGAARLVVSIAHDWALRNALAHRRKSNRELSDMVEVVFEGLSVD